MNNLNVLRDSLVQTIYKVYQPTFVKTPEITREKMYSDLKKSKYWTKETRQFLTAGSQLLATLSFGWYGYHYLSTNQQDFDYHHESIITILENKITAGHMVRYDDNSWATNRNHVYAGTVYYLQCRSSGLSALQSYLCTIAGSVAWEAVIEWREVFSINDTIFTSHGGAILGEAIHQMGKYIDQSAPRWFKNSIGWAYKGPKKLGESINRNLLDGDNSDLETSDNPLLNGKMEFEFGTLQIKNGVSQKRVGFNSEVNMISHYTTAGHETKFIRNVLETQLNFDAQADDFFNQYDIFAKVVLSAYYEKNLSVGEDGKLSGHTFYVGPSAALDIKNQMSAKNDFMGIVHIIGPTAKLINYYKGFKITSTLDFWGDSVMMRSMLVEEYMGTHPNSELVGNLSGSNYFHGWGVTSKGQVIIEYGKWSLGATIQNNYFENTNSRQRTLESAIKELNIQGKNLEAEIYIERKINNSLKIKFATQRQDKTEIIEGFGSKNKTFMTHKISLMYYF